MSNVRSNPQYRCDVIKDQTCHLPSPSYHALKHAILVRKRSVPWEREPPARSPPAPTRRACVPRGVAPLSQRFPPLRRRTRVEAYRTVGNSTAVTHSPATTLALPLHANQFIHLCHQRVHRSGVIRSTSDSPVVHPAVRPHGSEHLNDTLCQSRYDPMRRLTKSVVNLPRRTGCISRYNLLCSKWHEGVLPTACCAVHGHLDIDGPVRSLRIDISRQWARSNCYGPIHL